MLKSSEIEEILRLIDASDFQHVRLQMGETKLEWSRSGISPTSQFPTPQTPEIFAPKTEDRNDGSTAVPAPMLGAFWHAPRPGDAAFVKIGDRVKPDTIIGIIEVMKLMNTVSAGVAGVVTEMCPNGKAVEFGQTLIRVRNT